MARTGGSYLTGLEEHAAKLKALVNAIPDAVQRELDVVASDAVVEMAPRINGAIEGGPVTFMKVKPGKRSSSIVASRPRNGAQKGVAESRIYVQKAQSAILKYSLGGDDSRPHGDVGSATAENFTAQPDALKPSGIRLKKGGTAPASMLTTLVGRIKDTKAAREAERAERKAMTKEERKAAGRRWKSRDRGGPTDIFYGTPAGQAGAAKGFYQRPANRKGSLTLLVSAVKESEYDGNSLSHEWNEAVTVATVDMRKRMERTMSRVIDDLPSFLQLKR